MLFIVQKNFSKKNRMSSVEKMGDRQKYILRNVGSLKEKKNLFPIFKVNKVNLRGKYTLP